MNRDEFLKELTKEGLLIYGTTWESNLKRLKEIKKYKQMWEEFEKFHREHPYDYRVLSSNDVYKALQNIEQKYFPEPIKKIINWEDRFNELEEEFEEREKELIEEIEYWKSRNYSGRNHGI